MNRILLIARREWKERVRQRSFRVATLINLVVILIAASVPTVIAYFQDDTTGSTTVAVIDEAGVNAIEQLTPYVSIDTSGDSIELRAADFAASEANQRVESGDVDAVLTVRRDADEQLAFEYVNEDGEFDATARLVISGLAALSFSDRLIQAGVTEEQIASASAAPSFTIAASSGDTAESDSDEIVGTKLAIAFISAIIMFMAIQLYGTWIAQGVVEEKANRIMEIMINAATPRDLLAGKVIGIGLAGLSQLIPMLLVGGLAFGLQPRIGRAFDVDTASVFGNIDFRAVGLTAVGGFLIYFAVGFILYASLYAGVASMLSRQEDLNSAVGPLMIFMMVGYISAFLVLPVPDSLFARIVSIFPLTSPFTMAGRMVVTDVPAWELALSIGLLILAAILGVLIASRIYRIGVLMYGQKPSFREVFRNRKLLGTSR
ncbi:MAG: ABC transporter permease [Thermomicrobiales bacterium]|nr:ABC transporter permease [Thermomicrobiales bacterium]